MSTNHVKTSGVQDLVNRLRENGLLKDAGKRNSLVEEARRKAAMIVEEAETEAAEDSRGSDRCLQADPEEQLKRRFDWRFAIRFFGCERKWKIASRASWNA